MAYKSARLRSQTQGADTTASRIKPTFRRTWEPGCPAIARLWVRVSARLSSSLLAQHLSVTQGYSLTGARFNPCLRDLRLVEAMKVGVDEEQLPAGKHEVLSPRRDSGWDGRGESGESVQRAAVS